MPRSRALARWLPMRLAHDAPPIEPAAGLAILWPDQDIDIAHDGREIALRGDDLTILDRTQPFRIAGSEGWSARLLALGDRRIADRVDDRSRFVAVPLDGTTPVADLLKRMWVIGEDVGALGLADEAIHGHMAALFTDLGGRLIAQGIDGRVPSHAIAMIDRARALIAMNLTDPDFGVGTLAERMRISPRRLSSLFAAVGTTTAHAILDARLEKGRTLLAEPANANRQIASIALACGFEDQSYFSRCFRQRYAVSPRSFRANDKRLS